MKGAVDPSRALEPRQIRIEDSQCPICKSPARWWSDGWIECEVCGIFDPKDYAETAPLRRAEQERQREREDTDA